MKKQKIEYAGTIFDFDDAPKPDRPVPSKWVTIYIAGSRDETTKAGGWGAVIVDEDDESRSMSGGDGDTTHARMELMATIKAIESLEEPSEVYLITDSDYLFRGMTEGLSKWINRGWKGILHQDLWQQAHDLLGKHFVNDQRIRVTDDDPNKVRSRRLARSEAAAVSRHG